MMLKSNKKNKDVRLTKKGRSGSRQLLLQVLYQHQLNGDQHHALLTQSIERAILWIGLCEFSFHKDTPSIVVINEAIELAKVFGAQDSFQFINGVLDSFLQEQIT